MINIINQEKTNIAAFSNNQNQLYWRPIISTVIALILYLEQMYYHNISILSKHYDSKMNFLGNLEFFYLHIFESFWIGFLVFTCWHVLQQKYQRIYPLVLYLIMPILSVSFFKAISYIINHTNLKFYIRIPNDVWIVWFFISIVLLFCIFLIKRSKLHYGQILFILVLVTPIFIVAFYFDRNFFLLEYTAGLAAILGILGFIGLFILLGRFLGKSLKNSYQISFKSLYISLILGTIGFGWKNPEINMDKEFLVWLFLVLLIWFMTCCFCFVHLKTRKTAINVLNIIWLVIITNFLSLNFVSVIPTVLSHSNFIPYYISVSEFVKFVGYVIVQIMLMYFFIKMFFPKEKIE